MQNKANFRKVKFNVTEVLTKDYGQMDTWSIRKTKPIQTQFKANQTQLKPIKCKNKPKTNPNKANACPPSVWRIKGKKMQISSGKCRLKIILEMFPIIW
jgi:hypothetical protein